MPIRVLVVDDSIVFRTKLQLGLSEDPEIQVVACAIDAADALKKIRTFSPDVVTLDVEMPNVNGIDFLKDLIPKHPIPVVVVSALPLNALDALSAGAVDFVRKPMAGRPNTGKLFIEDLKAKVKIASKAQVQRPILQKRSAVITQMSEKKMPSNRNLMIAIGASTGGTEAIIQVVKDLPITTPAIVIVQHMPANFTTLYAQRLNKICMMQVKEAADMDRLRPGQIILGAGEFHLTVKKDASGYYIRSQRGEKVSGHCPSVDVLFDSVADVVGRDGIGVLLTGMGSDGARGLTKMSQQGAYTIGQDKASCVVYGMPMEAYKRGGVARQLPLQQIGDEIIYYLNRK